MERKLKYFTYYVMFVIVNFSYTRCETFANTKTYYSTLANFYSNSQKPLTNMIPAQDQSQPITLLLTMFLYSVDGFDAVSGQVDITGSIHIEWKDETRESSIGNFAFSAAEEGYSFTIDPEHIWTPQIMLLNAVDTVKNIGGNAFKARYQVSDGRVMWHSRTIIKASCTPDVQYYPFDRQTCNFIYTAWGYTTSEIVLEGGQSDWYLCDYVANGLWALVATSAEVYEKDGQSFMRFTFTIERQPMYFILNVVCPILLLGFLNGFVFLMPPDCGERVGFSITCFLTIVFMLQTVMSFLPQTADPMSIFCFYVVIMMIFSIISCVVTVLMLRIYHKPKGSEVPKVIKQFVRVISCLWVKPACRTCCKACKKTKDTGLDGCSPDTVDLELVIINDTYADTDKMKGFINDDVTDNQTNPFFNGDVTGNKSKGVINVKSAHDDELPSTSSSGESSFGVSTTASTSSLLQDTDDEADEHELENIEWTDVGKILDFFCFLVFLGAQGVISVIFLVPLATGAAKS